MFTTDYNYEMELMENDYFDFDEIDMDLEDDFWDSYDPE